MYSRLTGNNSPSRRQGSPLRNSTRADDLEPLNVNTSDESSSDAFSRSYSGLGMTLDDPSIPYSTPPSPTKTPFSARAARSATAPLTPRTARLVHDDDDDSFSASTRGRMASRGNESSYTTIVTPLRAAHIESGHSRSEHVSPTRESIADLDVNTSPYAPTHSGAIRPLPLPPAALAGGSGSRPGSPVRSLTPSVSSPPPAFPSLAELQNHRAVDALINMNSISSDSGAADSLSSSQPSSPRKSENAKIARSLIPAPVLAPPAGTRMGDYSLVGEDEDDEDDTLDRYSRSSLPSYTSNRRGTMSSAGYGKLDDEDDDESGSEYSYDEKEGGSMGSPVIESVPEMAQPRRHRSMARKQVRLVRGNLVLDCPVPTKLYSFLPRRDNDEFTYMRYTAATCEPDDFMKCGFTLRPANNDRETELVICITMYNEDEVSFTRTMHAVMKNIAHLCSRSKSRMWGKEGWKKVVVTIVADGRKKINPRVLDCLASMGIFQDGIAKNSVNGQEVKAHIYEYTTQISLDSDLKFKGAEKGVVPVQVLFCLKENQAKKLNSHRWLFNAFCPILQPNVCVLLDVGTRPGNTSLYHLWKAFDQDSNVAGASGEIRAMLGKGWRNLLNPIVAAQNFEYKMSNILDKPMESVFGYITVLPGALSAYRYIALQNDSDGNGPLAQYFKGEKLEGKDADVFTANMYLAEDRILCWELVAKKGEKWLLKYVSNCTGDTDVPDAVAEFVSQRRRWLNGALFAALYAQLHFKQIWKTEHSIVRKISLHIEFIYQFVSLLFTFFSMANYFLTVYFITGSLSDDSVDPFGTSGGFYIFVILKILMTILIASQFIISLGNRPQGARAMIVTSMALFALITAYATGCGIYYIARELTNTDDNSSDTMLDMVVSIASTFGLYIVMSVLYLDPWHMVTSLPQYFLLTPSYICILQVYAFCNTHDVTWGTKGEDKSSNDLGAAVGGAGKDIVEVEMPSEQLDIDAGYEDALANLRERKQVEGNTGPSAHTIKEDYYRGIRTRVVLLWMIANMILVLVVTQAYDVTNTGSNKYLAFILWSVAILAVFRGLGSFIYLCIRVVTYLAETKVRTKDHTRALTEKFHR